MVVSVKARGVTGKVKRSLALGYTSIRYGARKGMRWGVHLNYKWLLKQLTIPRN
jgi:hypothetical protein